MGIEPTSSAWKAEVLPLNYTRRCTAPADLEPVSFSPPPYLGQSVWWRGKDSNLRRRKPADLQSAPVGRLGTPPRKRAAYSDFQGAECQCILARKLLAKSSLTSGRSLSKEVERPESGDLRERQSCWTLRSSELSETFGRMSALVGRWRGGFFRLATP